MFKTIRTWFKPKEKLCNGTHSRHAWTSWGAGGDDLNWAGEFFLDRNCRRCGLTHRENRAVLVHRYFCVVYRWSDRRKYHSQVFSADEVEASRLFLVWKQGILGEEQKVGGVKLQFGPAPCDLVMQPITPTP